MGFSRNSLIIALAICSIAISRPQSVAAEPKQLESVEYWFSAVDPFMRNILHWPENDYARLFEEPSYWPYTTSKIDVLNLSTQFIIHGDPNILKLAIDWSNKHNVKLALSGLMLAPGPNKCGMGIEGYTGPDDIFNSAVAIQKHGGVLTYIAMDEPLYFGHFEDGKNACHTSTRELAQEIASRVIRAKSIFPKIVLGDIEPVGTRLGPLWISTLREFYTELAAAGTPVSFVHIDANWGVSTWPDEMIKFASLARSQQMRIGIIYDGVGFDTNKMWIEAALKRAKIIETEMMLSPDHVVFATWTRSPDMLLPESDKSTMTGFVRSYFESQKK